MFCGRFRGLSVGATFGLSPVSCQGIGGSERLRNSDILCGMLIASLSVEGFIFGTVFDVSQTDEVAANV